MKTVNQRGISVKFPLAGEIRQAGYTLQREPYSTPYAVNVCGMDSFERRRRGGSRPGLTKACFRQFSNIRGLGQVDYNDSGTPRRDLVIIANGAIWYLQGTAVTQQEMAILTESGQPLLTETGEAITYAFNVEAAQANSTPATVAALNAIGNMGVYNTATYGGKLYIAGASVIEYDPIAKTATALENPEADCPLIAFYRERMFLAGKDNLWFSSRAWNISDFSFSDDSGDVSQPVAGRVDYGKITAMFPVQDRALVLATDRSIWLMNGDPVAGGTLQQISNEVGMISYCVTPEGLVVFLANDGLYLWQPGAGIPTPFSAEAIPAEMRNVDATTNYVSMVYDHESRNVSLFVSPAVGRGKHWLVDLKNKALWPMQFAADRQPVVAASFGGRAIIAGMDGYLRRFDIDALTDDGVALESHLVLGPFRVSGSEIADGLLTEIHAMLADNAGTVSWSVFPAATAEEATDDAQTAVDAWLAGSAVSGVVGGSWGSNKNQVSRPRARGPWAAIWMRSANRWAFESMTLVCQTLGRLR